MAIVVEDGTGKIDAVAYVDAAYVDAYFTARGNANWTGDDTVKEAAIVRATDYIENKYGSRFLGRREFPDTPQALSFPRLYLYDREGYVVEGIPEKLKKASAEYALRALSAALQPDPTTGPSGQVITSESKKVGPIQTSFTYLASAVSQATFPPYPAADVLLKEFISSGGGAYR